MHHAYCTILSCHCSTATWNVLFTGLFYGVSEHNTEMFLFFLNSDTVLFDSTPENFANIWQIKWSWTRSIKFEKLSANSRFLFVVRSRFCYHGQPRPQGFSLKRWVGREMALASASHAYGLNIPEKLIYMQPAGFALTEVERSNNGK